jgi:hypothetical protein
MCFHQDNPKLLRLGGIKTRTRDFIINNIGYCLAVLIITFSNLPLLYGQQSIEMIQPVEFSSSVSVTNPLRFRTLLPIDSSSIRPLTPFPMGGNKPTITVLKTADFLDTTYQDYVEVNGVFGLITIEDSVTLRFDLPAHMKFAHKEGYTVLLQGIRVINNTGDTLSVGRTIFNAFTTIQDVPRLESVSPITEIGCQQPLVLKFTEKLPYSPMIISSLVSVLHETGSIEDTNGYISYSYDTLAINTNFSQDSTSFIISPNNFSYEKGERYKIIYRGSLLTGNYGDDKTFFYTGKVGIDFKITPVLVSAADPNLIQSIPNEESFITELTELNDTLYINSKPFFEKYKFQGWYSPQNITISNQNSYTNAYIVVNCNVFTKDSVEIFARYIAAEVDTLELIKPQVSTNNTLNPLAGLGQHDYGVIVTGYLDSLGNGKYTFPRTPHYPMILIESTPSTANYKFTKWDIPTTTIEWQEVNKATELPELHIPIYTRSSGLINGINGKINVGHRGGHKDGPEQLSCLSLTFCLKVQMYETSDMYDPRVNRQNQRAASDPEILGLVDVNFPILRVDDNKAQGCSTVTNQNTFSGSVTVTLKPEFQDCYEIVTTLIRVPISPDNNSATRNFFLRAVGGPCEETWVVYLRRRPKFLFVNMHLNNFEDMPMTRYHRRFTMRRLDQLGIAVTDDGTVPAGLVQGGGDRMVNLLMSEERGAYDRKIIANEPSTQHNYLRRIVRRYKYFCNDDVSFRPVHVEQEIGIDPGRYRYHFNKWICTQDPQSEGRNLYCDDITQQNVTVRNFNIGKTDKVIQYEFGSKFLVLGISYKDQNNNPVWLSLIDILAPSGFRGRLRMDLPIPERLNPPQLPLADQIDKTDLLPMLHRKYGQIDIVFNRKVNQNSIQPDNENETGISVQEYGNRFDHGGYVQYRFKFDGNENQKNSYLIDLQQRHINAETQQLINLTLKSNSEPEISRYISHMTNFYVHFREAITSINGSPLKNTGQSRDIRTDYPGLYFMVKSIYTSSNDNENCPSTSNDGTAELIVAELTSHISSRTTNQGQGYMYDANNNHVIYNIKREVFRIDRLRDNHALTGLWKFYDYGSNSGLRSKIQTGISTFNSSVSALKVAKDVGTVGVLSSELYAILSNPAFIIAAAAIKLAEGVANNIWCPDRYMGDLELISAEQLKYQEMPFSPFFFREGSGRGIINPQISLYGMNGNDNNNNESEKGTYNYSIDNIGSDFAKFEFQWILGDL